MSRAMPIRAVAGPAALALGSSAHLQAEAGRRRAKTKAKAGINWLKLGLIALAVLLIGFFGFMQAVRGGMFGEMSLISAQPRSASAIAADTTSVLALSNDTIRQSMPPHVSLQLLSNIITTLSTRLRQANER